MTKTHERGEPGLDVLRSVAVVMMFAVHVRRVQLPGSRSGSGPAEAGLDFFMRIEPFITSLFLFVAGYSVVLGWRAAAERNSWWRKAWRRATQLYALSVGLYVLQYGIDLPDMLLSSGILQVIAVSILLVGACLSARQPDHALGAMCVFGIALETVLEATGKSVSGLNAGPGGSVPLFAHAAFGALVARAVSRDRAGALWRLALVTSLLSGLVLLTHGDWTTVHVSHYRDLGGESFVTAWFAGSWHAAPQTAVHFWNHSTRGAVALLGPLVLFLALFLILPRKLVGAKALYAPRVVGRHALLVYVFHLCALGALAALGLVPTSALGSWGFIAVLFAVGFASAAALERVR